MEASLIMYGGTYRASTQ